MPAIFLSKSKYIYIYYIYLPQKMGTVCHSDSIADSTIWHGVHTAYASSWISIENEIEWMPIQFNFLCVRTQRRVNCVHATNVWGIYLYIIDGSDGCYLIEFRHRSLVLINKLNILYIPNRYFSIDIDRYVYIWL